MVLNLPKNNFEVKVGPYTYSVCYDKDIAAEGQVFGSTHNADQKIFLDPDRPSQKIEHTFLHEVLHACTFVSGLAYRFEEKSERQPDEEDIVRELSTSLFQFIQDNPQLFKYEKNNFTRKRP